MKQYLNIQHLK